MSVRERLEIGRLRGGGRFMFRRIYLCRTLATSLELTYLEPVPELRLRMVDFVILPSRREQPRQQWNDADRDKAKEKNLARSLACLEYLTNRPRNTRRILENMPVPNILKDLHARHTRQLLPVTLTHLHGADLILRARDDQSLSLDALQIKRIRRGAGLAAGRQGSALKPALGFPARLSKRRDSPWSEQ
jgi:hypothetical protein